MNELTALLSTRTGINLLGLSMMSLTRVLKIGTPGVTNRNLVCRVDKKLEAADSVIGLILSWTKYIKSSTSLNSLVTAPSFLWCST